MHYDRAPITEALIDIRVELPSDSKLEHLQEIVERLSGEYPRKDSCNLAQGTIVFGPEPKATTEHKQTGWMLHSADGKQVVQVRLDGFTFSRLEPYETWERLRDEAERLWNIYREVARPRRSTRVALRYINQLNFPGSRIELEEYLNTFPQLSENLPSERRDFGPFFLSLRIPQQDLQGMLILNEVLANPKSPGTLSVILDLDLFVEHPQIPDELSLWDLFQRLRERKNLYFEACITNKTRELIS